MTKKREFLFRVTFVITVLHREMRSRTSLSVHNANLNNRRLLGSVHPINLHSNGNTSKINNSINNPTTSHNSITSNSNSNSKNRIGRDHLKTLKKPIPSALTK